MEISDEGDKSMIRSMAIDYFMIWTSTDKVMIPNHEKWYWLQRSMVTMKGRDRSTDVKDSATWKCSLNYSREYWPNVNMHTIRKSRWRHVADHGSVLVLLRKVVQTLTLGLDIEIPHLKGSDREKKLIYGAYNRRSSMVKGRKVL